MTTKKIILTLPEPILKILKKEKKKFAYNTIQEIIVEALRDKFFRAIPKTTKKRGRPRGIRPERIITRKNLFVKKGGEIVDI